MTSKVHAMAVAAASGGMAPVALRALSYEDHMSIFHEHSTVIDTKQATMPQKRCMYKQSRG